MQSAEPSPSYPDLQGCGIPSSNQLRRLHHLQGWTTAPTSWLSRVHEQLLHHNSPTTKLFHPRRTQIIPSPTKIETGSGQTNNPRSHANSMQFVPLWNETIPPSARKFPNAINSRNGWSHHGCQRRNAGIPPHHEASGVWKWDRPAGTMDERKSRWNWYNAFHPQEWSSTRLFQRHHVVKSPAIIKKAR